MEKKSHSRAEFVRAHQSKPVKPGKEKVGEFHLPAILPPNEGVADVTMLSLHELQTLEQQLRIEWKEKRRILRAEKKTFVPVPTQRVNALDIGAIVQALEVIDENSRPMRIAERDFEAVTSQIRSVQQRITEMHRQEEAAKTASTHPSENARKENIETSKPKNEQTKESQKGVFEENTIGKRQRGKETQTKRITHPYEPFYTGYVTVPEKKEGEEKPKCRIGVYRQTGKGDTYDIIDEETGVKEAVARKANQQVRKNEILRSDVEAMLALLQEEPLGKGTKFLREQRRKINGVAYPLREFAPNRAGGLQKNHKYSPDMRIVYTVDFRKNDSPVLIIVDIVTHSELDRKF